MDKLELARRTLSARWGESLESQDALLGRISPQGMMDMFEVAQIREITREVGRFGGIMRLLFVAEKTTGEGTETIAMSSEFEWQKDKKVSEDELEQASRTLHNAVLQSLLAEGWEPVGTDEKGRVMALRRKLNQSQDEPEDSSAEGVSWSMTRPWRTEQKAPTS